MLDPVAAVTDIGGSTVRIALVTSAGEVVGLDQWPVNRHVEPGELFRQVVEGVWALAARCDLTRDRIIGFGVSLAGEIDAVRGYVYDAINLGWRDVQLVDALQSLSGKPALLEMDGHAAALGEAWLGEGRGVQNMALIIVGTGIGAGLILDGHLYRGQGGLAGEFGHITVQQDGPLCGCGRYGCLEAMASGLAIAQAARAAVLRGAPTSLSRQPGDPQAADVLDAARAGDVCALSIVERAAHALGTGITSLIHLLAPELIVLSGGVALNGHDLLLPTIQRDVNLQIGYWARHNTRRIVTSPLGDRSGLFGAAYRVFEECK